MKPIHFINDFENHLKREANIFLIVKELLFKPITFFILLAVWPMSLILFISIIWNVYKIKKDLKGKHYLPLQMQVIYKHYREGDGETAAQYQIQLQHLATTTLLSKYAQKKLTNNFPTVSFQTTIQVSGQIYDEIEVNQTAFFLVGHYSGVWMSRTKSFTKSPFGIKFF